jgi:hypothetical protein
MKKDTNLLKGGYCFSIRNAGPFVIGKDFEAPGPAAGILPKMEVYPQKWDELWSFVMRGRESESNDSSDKAIFEYATTRLEFENGVNEALSWYVSDCEFQVEIPGFRKQLRKLRDAVKRFQAQLPDEYAPLGHFLHQIYTGAAMLPDRLRPSEPQLTVLQNSWQDRVGMTAIKETLDAMLHNIEAAQLLIGNKKPRQHQVGTFVQTLAMVWNEATGHWPKSGRDPMSNNTQSGPFADFVRATGELLPAPFRIYSLDRAIRAACQPRDRE